MAVLYPSFLSFTVTRTKTTRDPSGETWGSPIQTKLKRSFSVMLRFWANAGAAREMTTTRSSEIRTRIMGSFRETGGVGGSYSKQFLPRRKAENGRGFPLRLCVFAGDSLLRLAIHVVHHAEVIVCEEKGVFAEAE